jgi:hypothetical protein
VGMTLNDPALDHFAVGDKPCGCDKMPNPKKCDD